MNKTIRTTLLTAIVMTLGVWLASELFSFSYSEWSFFIGLGISVLLIFFNSSGGAFSRAATLAASQGMMKVQRDDNTFRLNAGGLLYGSLLYTLVSLAIMLVVYN